MSTLVLEVKFIDDTQSVDKEFTDLTALSVWLHGQRESDFDWLCLHDNNNDYVFEGWSDIVQYIRENTGPVLSTHNLSKCGEACNCIKCRTNQDIIDMGNEPWEDSEWVVDPFDTYEPHELPPDAPKSSCIALCGPAIPVEPDTTDYVSVPQPERFSDLPDGTMFYLAQTYSYGSRKQFIKTLSAGGPHNAVYNVYGGVGISVPDDRLVIRVTK